MPFSTTTLVRFTAKLSRCLSLALLPALASEARAISQPQRKQNVRSAQPAVVGKAGALPYLAALGPLPLRFARPGPEPTDEPPDSPKPKMIAQAEITGPDGKTPSKLPAETPATGTLATGARPAQPDPHTAEPLSGLSEPNAQPQLPILPDDTKRELRAEDVLPFFRYPGSAPASGDSGLQILVPVTPTQSQSNPLPPSSATYQQK